jgi:hypothetical protein
MLLLIEYSGHFSQILFRCLEKFYIERHTASIRRELLFQDGSTHRWIAALMEHLRKYHQVANADRVLQ